MSNTYSGISKVIRPSGQRPKGALAEAAPVITDLRPDGLTIPVDVIPPGVPLKVKLPSWTGRLDNDYYEFRMTKDNPPTNYLTDGIILVEDDAPDDKEDVPLEVPADQLVDDPLVVGPSRYFIWCVIYLAGLNPIETDVTAYIIDRFAPGENEQTGVKDKLKVMRYPATLVDPIDDDAIEDHPNGLVMTIDRSYNNPGVPPHGDSYEVWMSSSFSPSDPSLEPVCEGMLPANGEVTIPIALVARLTGQQVYIWCRLTDYAGNVSNISIPAGRGVNLLPPPVLEQITVPKADPVINIKDAAEGVTVEFNRGTDVQSTDHYVINYGGTIIYDEEAGAATSYSIPVDKSVVASKYIDATGGDQPVRVECNLTRGPIKVGNEVILVVLQNLEYAGPTNPDHPDPVNPAMDKLKVFGALNRQDELTPEDYGQNCRIDIKLWDEPGRQPQSGQEVRVYVDNKFVPPVIFLKDGDEDKTIPHVLPWDALKDIPPGQFQTHWTVSTIGSVNVQESDKTDVIFGAIKIDLKAPTVVGARNGQVGCPSTSSPDYGISIKVESDPVYLPKDAEVKVYFKGYSDFPGVTPNPHANPFWVAHKVLDTEVATGFTVRVTPFNPVLKYSTAEPDESVPGTYSGAADVWYEVPINNSPTPTPSPVTPYEVILIRPGYIYCDGSKYDDDKP